MSSETSAVNVHGAWSAKRLTLLAMMLALISVSSYIAIPLPFSDAKITAQTMIVNLIGLLIAPQDTILVVFCENFFHDDSGLPSASGKDPGMPS